MGKDKEEKLPRDGECAYGDYLAKRYSTVSCKREVVWTMRPSEAHKYMTAFNLCRTHMKLAQKRRTAIEDYMKNYGYTAIPVSQISIREALFG